jgi:hypothetical protein
MEELRQFLEDWTDDALGTKPIFIAYMNRIAGKDGVDLVFNARPGVSYSLRGIPRHREDRPLFVMIDIIDDNPRERWLSVCFYGDTIQDPEERGDLIPGGLLGEDGYCFDIAETDDHLAAYVGARIQEAYTNTRHDH